MNDERLGSGGELAAITDRAGYIFTGSVSAVGRAAMPGITADDDTAVIRVERAYKAPPDSVDFAGEEITVQLKERREPETRALFFAEGWMHGEGLALREIASTVGDADEELEHSIVAMIEEAPVRALSARIASAHLIVTGSAAEAERAPRPRQPRLSEHDPQWRLVTLELTEVLSGELIEPVIVAVPASDDVLWYRFPRPELGTQAVWILHREELRDLPKGALVAPDPLDIQPPSEAERIRDLAAKLR